MTAELSALRHLIVLSSYFESNRSINSQASRAIGVGRIWKRKCDALGLRPRFRMLRITIHDKKDAVVLSLEGELIGPWVQEVEQCWRKVFASLGNRSVHVDLSAVSFVDAAGGALLRRMQEAGFRFAERAEMGHAWDGEGFDSRAGAN